jgi:hypothetical protein
MTAPAEPPRSDLVIVSSRTRMQVCCDACYRTSPASEGPLDKAQERFRALGWTWRIDGRTVCPICNDRVSTQPPPHHT